MRIGDVLNAKASTAVVTIKPDAGVRELIAQLAEHNVGALIVSSDGESVDGIVSERDVVRHLHHDGTVVNNTVGAIMTAVVETCDKDTLVDDLMKIMTERRIRHVPVVADGKLTGHHQHRRRGQAPHRPARVRARPARQATAPDLDVRSGAPPTPARRRVRSSRRRRRHRRSCRRRGVRVNQPRTAGGGNCPDAVGRDTDRRGEQAEHQHLELHVPARHGRRTAAAGRRRS